MQTEYHNSFLTASHKSLICCSVYGASIDQSHVVLVYASSLKKKYMFLVKVQLLNDCSMFNTSFERVYYTLIWFPIVCISQQCVFSEDYCFPKSIYLHCFLVAFCTTLTTGSILNRYLYYVIDIFICLKNLLQ